MKSRNFGKRKSGTTPPPPSPPQTPEQKAAEAAQKQAQEKANVKTEIRQQLAEKLTELSLDEYLIKKWVTEALLEFFAGFCTDYPEAQQNFLLAIGGDKREKSAATRDEVEAAIGKDAMAKIKTIAYKLGREV